MKSSVRREEMGFATKPLARGENVNKVPLLLAYTLLFAIIALIGFSPILKNGKAFLNVIDAVPLYFNLFVDTGETVRSAFQSLLNGDGLSFPAYDLSMGYGAPHAYPTDPLMYLSVFCPLEYSEAVYTFSVVLRMWLAGAIFLILARYLEFPSKWAVISSLVYVFSGWGLQSCLQMIWLNQLIYFPLVIYGALVLVRKRRPLIYIAASAALCLVCGIYQMYMSQIMVAVMVAVILVVSRARLRDWLHMLVCFLGSLVMAVLIAAPVSFVELGALLTLDRLDVEYSNPILYSAGYYQHLLGGFAGIYAPERDWFFGFGALALICCLALFAVHADRTTTVLKVLFVVGTVFVCVPLFGLIFNGFSYTVNRWVYGYTLLVACIVGAVGTHSSKLGKREFAISAILLGLYTIAVVALPDARSWPTCVQTSIAWVILIGLFCGSQAKPDSRIRAAIEGVVVVAAVLALGVNYFMCFSIHGLGYYTRLIDAGTALDRAAEKSPLAMARATGDDELYRTDRAYTMDNHVMTVGLLSARVLDVYAIDYYTTLYNNNVNKFHTELELAGTVYPNYYASLDARAALMQVMGVKYYIDSQNDGMPLPYDCNTDEIDSLDAYDGQCYALYKMEGAAPIAAVYKGVISQDRYESLNAIEKQEALLQGVVLDGEISGAEPRITSEEVEYGIINVSDDITIEDGDIIVHSPGSSIELSVSNVQNAELYLETLGLEFSGFSPRECYSDEEWEILTQPEKDQVEKVEEVWTNPWSFSISIDSEYSSGVFEAPTSYSHLYGGRKDWLWNIGYSEDGTSTITLTFAQPGVYSFDEFRVLAQPMGTLDEAKARMMQNPVENLVYENDTISCDVGTGSGRYLFLSVPYSSYWNAAVDGKPVEILKADTAFMAVRLPSSGGHVEFHYSSPMPYYFVIGVIATCALVAAWVVRRRRGVRDDEYACYPLIPFLSTSLFCKPQKTS